MTNSANKAQELFKEKGYETSDNRSLDWRNINKALEYGIEITVASVGKTISDKEGNKWKLCLKYKSLKTYFKASNINQYNAGAWKSASADIVGGLVLSYILQFRQRLIDKGLFKVGVDFEKSETMCKCLKCSGKGIIPAFMHISKGVCFDCMGLGYGKQGKVSI